jgi:transposase
MEALTLGLRERVAAACDEGTRSQREIAEDFGVSVSFITKLLRRRRQGGGVVPPPKPHAGGFPSAIDAAADRELRALVAEQPDATLAELRDRLAAHRPSAARSVPVICRALARLGLPRKKRRCGRPSATRRGSAGCAARSAANSRRSCRNGAW